MPFLSKIKFVQTAKKDRIQIDIQQVEEVFAVLTGEWIGGPVRAGERIHKGIQRAPGHHKEGVTYRILFTATEAGVLQNMRHTGRVLRDRAQRNQKHILAVISRNMVMFGTGLFMTILGDLYPQRFD